MTTGDKRRSLAASPALTVLLLLVVAAGGIGALQYFVRQLLQPGDLGAFSLPIVALVGGVAATFNPCGLPVLPGFLATMGGSGADSGRRDRASMSLGASLGAITVVLAVGIVVALVGEGTKGFIGPNFRWVQLAVGVFMIGVAILHLLNKTHNFPLVGPIMSAGSQMWEGSLSTRNMRNSYLFGAGFVLVGVD